MKTLTPQLQAAKDAGTLATAVKLTSALDGDVEAFTNFDYEVEIDSVTYTPVAGLERITMNLRNNAEVSNQEMAAGWAVDLPDTELNEGKWDNAEIEVFKFNWTSPSNGKIPIFKGRFGMVQWSTDGFRVDIHSTMRDLQRPVGVQVTTKCRHQLYSTSGDEQIGFCGVNKGANTFTGTVSAVDPAVPKMKFTITTSEPDDWFANGIIRFTSGNNANIEREVKTQTGSAVELFRPFPYVIQVGDAYEIYAGCDKTWNTCRNKFSNGDNYGGFPHIRNEVNFK